MTLPEEQTPPVLENIPVDNEPLYKDKFILFSSVGFAVVLVVIIGGYFLFKAVNKSQTTQNVDFSRFSKIKSMELSSTPTPTPTPAYQNPFESKSSEDEVNPFSQLESSATDDEGDYQNPFAQL